MPGSYPSWALYSFHSTRLEGFWAAVSFFTLGSLHRGTFLPSHLWRCPGLRENPSVLTVSQLWANEKNQCTDGWPVPGNILRPGSKVLMWASSLIAKYFVELYEIRDFTLWPTKWPFPVTVPSAVASSWLFQVLLAGVLPRNTALASSVCTSTRMYSVPTPGVCFYQNVLCSHSRFLTFSVLPPTKISIFGPANLSYSVERHQEPFVLTWDELVALCSRWSPGI